MNTDLSKKLFWQRILRIPIAVTAANFNVISMRMQSIREGVEVKSQNGTFIGVSKIAAACALKEVIISRSVLVTIIIGMPALLSSYFEKYN
jgi:hypothetical protein